ncbi:MAG: BACON domain-containing carbohydrate-binding protein [Rikenellaceae bacterium]
MNRIKFWGLLLLTAISFAYCSKDDTTSGSESALKYEILNSIYDLDELPSGGVEALEVQFDVDGEWSITPSESLSGWAEITTTTMGSKSTDLSGCDGFVMVMDIDPNSGYSSRSGSITITLNNEPYTLTITQSGQLTTSVFRFDAGVVSSDTTFANVPYSGTGIGSVSIITSNIYMRQSEATLRSVSLPDEGYTASGLSYIQIVDASTFEVSNITIDAELESLVSFGLNQLGEETFDSSKFTLQYSYDGLAWSDCEYTRSASEVAAWGYATATIPSGGATLSLRFISTLATNLVDDINLVQSLASQTPMVEMNEDFTASYNQATFSAFAFYMPTEEAIDTEAIKSVGFSYSTLDSESWSDQECSYPEFTTTIEQLTPQTTYSVKAYVVLVGGDKRVESEPISVTTTQAPDYKLTISASERGADYISIKAIATVLVGEEYVALDDSIVESLSISCTPADGETQSIPLASGVYSYTFDSLTEGVEYTFKASMSLTDGEKAESESRVYKCYTAPVYTLSLSEIVNMSTFNQIEIQLDGELSGEDGDVAANISAFSKVEIICTSNNLEVERVTVSELVDGKFNYLFEGLSEYTEYTFTLDAELDFAVASSDSTLEFSNNDLSITTPAEPIVLGGISMSGYLQVGDTQTFEVVVPYSGSLQAEDITISMDGITFLSASTASTAYDGFSKVMTYSASGTLSEAQTLTMSYKYKEDAEATTYKVAVYDELGVASLMDTTEASDDIDGWNSTNTYWSYGAYCLGSYASNTGLTNSDSAIGTISLPNGITINNTSGVSTAFKWQIVASTWNTSGLKFNKYDFNSYGAEITNYVDISLPITSGAKLSSMTITTTLRAQGGEEYDWHMDISIDGGSTWITANEDSALGLDASATSVAVYTKNYTLSGSVKSEDLANVKVRLYAQYKDGYSSVAASNLMQFNTINITTNR